MQSVHATVDGCDGTPVTPFCADRAAQGGLAPLIPQLAPTPSAKALAWAVLGNLSIENSTSPVAQQLPAPLLPAPQAGLPVSWMDLVWAHFPTAAPAAITVAQWTIGLVDNWTPTTQPLPIPTAIRSQFVDGANDAMLVYVTFAVGDSFTTSSGANPVFHDLPELDRIVPTVLSQTDPGRTLSYVQTGGAALDLTESNDLSS